MKTTREKTKELLGSDLEKISPITSGGKKIKKVKPFFEI